MVTGAQEDLAVSGTEDVRGSGTDQFQPVLRIAGGSFLLAGLVQVVA